MSKINQYGGTLPSDQQLNDSIVAANAQIQSLHTAQAALEQVEQSLETTVRQAITQLGYTHPGCADQIRRINVLEAQLEQHYNALVNTREALKVSEDKATNGQMRFAALQHSLDDANRANAEARPPV